MFHVERTAGGIRACSTWNIGSARSFAVETLDRAESLGEDGAASRPSGRVGFPRKGWFVVEREGKGRGGRFLGSFLRRGAPESAPADERPEDPAGTSGPGSGSVAPKPQEPEETTDPPADPEPAAEPPTG